MRRLSALICLTASLTLSARLSPKKFLSETSECSKIVAGSIAAACLYGIALDQVTARVCPEYFTQGFHREDVENMPDCWVKTNLSGDPSPTKLGLIWGIIATWWVGAGISVPVTLAARSPFIDAPKLGMKDLVKPTACALGCIGLSSLVAGIVGYRLAVNDQVDRDFFRRKADGTPEESLNYFIADAFAHSAGYASGALAGIGLTGWIIYERLARKKKASTEK